MTKNIEAPGMKVPPEIMDELTRKDFLVGGAAALLLAGCGGGGEGGEASGETRTVEDFYGSVEVPEEPRRIIAENVNVLANLVALGVGERVVGAGLTNFTGAAFLEGEIEDIENVDTIEELNLEAIAALDPDLIVVFGADFFTEPYERVSQLPIPVFAAEYNYVTLEQTTTFLRSTAVAVNREERAEEIIADMFERVESIREALGEDMGEMDVSVLRIGDGSYYVTFGSIESSLMCEIGIPRPPNQRDFEEFGFELSLERVGDIDAHTIFVFADEDTEETRDRLESSPLWQRLEAVENDRVFFVEGSVWNGTNILSALYILDDLEKHLLEGEGST